MDKEKKLKIQIIVTLVIAVLMVGGMVGAWAMVLVKPLTEEMKITSDALATAKGTAKKLADAKTALEDANVKEKRLGVQLAFFRNRYRSFDFKTWGVLPDTATEKEKKAYPQLGVDTWNRLMHESSYDYGPRLWGEIHGAAEASGVTITKLDDIRTEAPPKGPEDMGIPTNGFFMPTGPTPLNITVTGTLDQLLTFLRRIHEGQILMKVGGGLKLDGASPHVQVSFTIQPYLVAKGKYVALTAAGAAPAVAAAAGGAASVIANVAANATTPIGGNGNSARP